MPNLGISAALACALAGGTLGAVAGAAQVSVPTQHNDTFRTGLNAHETLLTPSNVNTAGFGKLFSQAVDGNVYAQPLYLSGVNIQGKGTHNVVYVATENDSVYAFDADNNQGSNAKPLWRKSFINPAQGITAVPSTDLGCNAVIPKIGISGTPVIDTGSGTLYLVAYTKENGSYVQRLHAISVVNGAEKFGGPVLIQGAGGNQTFAAVHENQRAALLLSHGTVYIAWAANCDINPYTGWVMAYGARSLQQTGVFTTTTDYQNGGVWQSGAGLAADSAGSVYLATGNGTFDADQNGSDYGGTILRLAFSTGQLAVQDYFTPDDQNYINNNDLDLGSGGVLLLPTQPGAHPNLLIEGGKEGTVYLADRGNLGRYSPTSNNNVQTLYFAVGGLWSMPAYWNSNVYFWGSNDFIKAFSLTNGLLSGTPTSEGPEESGFPGATPSVSANGSTNGIVWAIESDAYNTLGPAVLHAYDATNVATELYSSSQNLSRDNPGAAVKFTVPTIANGKVYVGTANQLSVYGLLGQR